MKTKIASSERKQSFQKRKLILPLFLVGLMVFSAFAVFLSSPNTAPDDTFTQEYKGITFTQQGTLWEATIRGRQVLLRYGPSTLEELHTELDLTQIHSALNTQKIYLSIFPEDPAHLPLQELYANLKPYTPQLYLACIEDGEGCENLPLKTCADATANAGVVILEKDEGTVSITGKGTCYTLKGNERDLLQVIDKLVLSFYGL